MKKWIISILVILFFVVYVFLMFGFCMVRMKALDQHQRTQQETIKQRFIEEIDNDSVDGPGDGPGDGDPTVKTEAETKKDDAEVSAPKGFQTDAATSADVVSETTPAQNTESQQIKLKAILYPEVLPR